MGGHTLNIIWTKPKFVWSNYPPKDTWKQWQNLLIHTLVELSFDGTINCVQQWPPFGHTWDLVQWVNNDKSGYMII